MTREHPELPDDPMPADDPAVAIAELREQLQAALAAAERDQAEIADLRRQLAELTTPPTPTPAPSPAPRKGFWNEEI